VEARGPVGQRAWSFSRVQAMPAASGFRVHSRARRRELSLSRRCAFSRPARSAFGGRDAVEASKREWRRSLSRECRALRHAAYGNVALIHHRLGGSCLRALSSAKFWSGRGHHIPEVWLSWWSRDAWPFVAATCMARGGRIGECGGPERALLHSRVRREPGRRPGRDATSPREPRRAGVRARPRPRACSGAWPLCFAHTCSGVLLSPAHDAPCGLHEQRAQGIGCRTW